jgi:hypothetical protein
MSVKLKAKNTLFQILNMLPERLGYVVYHKFQEWFDNSSIHDKIKSSHSSYLTFERLAKKTNISILNKRIIEIGSGWLPLMPYFFKYLGKASRVETYDLNKHYNKKNIKILNREFSKQFENSIAKNETNQYDLPEGIHYFPKTDLTKIDIKKVGFVFSRFVLEHVSPQDIIKMHQKFKEELPDAHIVHLISPSDHRAYVDKSLSNQDFLSLSEEEWNKKQTRFDYHNRMRLPQYLEIFKNLGYEVLHLEFECAPIDSETYKKFKTVPLHIDYQKYSDDELTAGSINIVLKLR